MWFQPSNPQDKLRSQLEYENFKEEKAEKKKFFNNIERIANGANKKSTFATILSIISLLISLASFIVQLLEYID